MNNNNESVHLWMLEQDRQKSRATTLEQQKTRQSASEELPHIPDYLLPSSRGSNKEGENAAMDNEIENIEQLIREKEGLEEESKRLDEEKEQLILQTRSILERVVEDLKKKNSEKQQAVDQLKRQFCNLETQLR